MALSEVTTTFNLHDYFGNDFDPRRTKGWATNNADDQTIHDKSTGETRIGSGVATIAADGTGTFTHWAPGPDGNPTSWQTTYHFDVSDRNAPGGRRHKSFGPFTVTTSGLLTALVEQQEIPPTYLSQVTGALQAYVASGTAAATSAAASADIAEAITGADTADDLITILDANAASDFRIQQDTRQSARYGRKRALDVRDYGAVCDGTTDDTTAIQAAITAAGANGTVELPPLSMKITAPLVLLAGTELRGVGTKPSRLMISTDVTAISSTGGQGQAIRNLKVWNTFAGTRTTYDIDINTPTKVVIEDVEVDLPTAKTGLGGIRLLGNGAGTGNEFMPQLSRVWIRGGTLLIDGVTDGHFTDGFVWAGNDGAAAIHVIGSHLWTFTGVDVVPSDGAGSGYLFVDTEGAQIVGGYNDGGYSDNPTGYGLRAINSHRILVSGHHFYHNGRSAVQLESTRACSFVACGFTRGNKQNNFYPDINLVDSDHNTFLGTVHSQDMVRTNKGGVYREDVDSLHNTIDNASIDLSVGDNYAPAFIGNKGTPGGNNRPLGYWQTHAGAPDLIFPPAALVSVPAAATWPTANTAIFHRFTVSRGAPYRYANFRCDSGSGNVQAAVVSLSGTGNTDYTRVMTSGVIACTTGDKLLDMSSIYLVPGEYALVLWCDNTTATFRVASNTGLTAMRATATVTGLASGVPASGSVGATWGSSNYVGGLSLGLTV